MSQANSTVFRPATGFQAHAERFELALGTAQRGGLPGERLGRGPGASLEFEDRRDYLVGDDLRHVDWAAYARSDRLLVRQYREEIAPRLEILLDTSRSLAVHPAKAQLAVDLAAALAHIAQKSGLSVRLELLAEKPEQPPLAHFLHSGTSFDSRAELPELLQRRPRSAAKPLILLISDFLIPSGPAASLAALAASAQSLGLIQILSNAELEPSLDGPLRLIDAKHGQHQDLIVGPSTLSDYQRRLNQHQQALTTSARRHSAPLALCPAESGLLPTLSGPLLLSGLVQPA